MTKKIEARIELRDAILAKLGSQDAYDRNDVLSVAESIGQGFPNWILAAANRVSRGMYAMPDVASSGVSKSVPAKVRVLPTPTVEAAPSPSLITDSDGFDVNLIPDRDDLYVSFGYHRTVKDIIKSKMFYSSFIN